eukprot:14555533-Alexandrium_andersonii.AAC.1
MEQPRAKACTHVLRPYPRPGGRGRAQFLETRSRRAVDFAGSLPLAAQEFDTIARLETQAARDAFSCDG